MREGVFEEATEAVETFANGNPDCEATIVNVPKLMSVNSFSLRMPRYDYATQAVIKPHRAWLLAACVIHYDLDFGLCTRYVGGKHTAKW